MSLKKGDRVELVLYRGVTGTVIKVSGLAGVYWVQWDSDPKSRPIQAYAEKDLKIYEPAEN